MVKGHHDIRFQSPGGDTWVSSHHQEPPSDPEAGAEGGCAQDSAVVWSPPPQSGAGHSLRKPILREAGQHKEGARGLDGLRPSTWFLLTGCTTSGSSGCCRGLSLLLCKMGAIEPKPLGHRVGETRIAGTPSVSTSPVSWGLYLSLGSPKQPQTVLVSHLKKGF